MLKAQIEKRIDVLQARYFTDEDIFILESSLLKISTPTMLENPDVCHIIREHGARIVEVNPTYTAIEKTGRTEDILSLFHALNELGVVRQFAAQDAFASRAVHANNSTTTWQNARRREPERNRLAVECVWKKSRDTGSPLSPFM